ncbi:MAG: helix-turn-helix transcriptional regulator [Clostridiales bacterium]|nr:helix-turn-helix transcriptional regulator [Clostridiales bacterium]
MDQLLQLQKDLGARIRSYRKAKLYNIEDLAHLADLNPAHLGKIERGERNLTLGTLLKIANALDVSLSELLDLERPVEKEEEPIISKTVACLRELTLGEQEHIYKTARLFSRNK